MFVFSLDFFAFLDLLVAFGSLLDFFDVGDLLVGSRFFLVCFDFGDFDASNNLFFFSRFSLDSDSLILFRFLLGNLLLFFVLDHTPQLM